MQYSKNNKIKKVPRDPVPITQKMQLTAKMVSKSPIAMRNTSISKKEKGDHNTVALMKVESDKLVRNLDICLVHINYKDETADI